MGSGLATYGGKIHLARGVQVSHRDGLLRDPAHAPVGRELVGELEAPVRPMWMPPLGRIHRRIEISELRTRRTPADGAAAQDVLEWRRAHDSVGAEHEDIEHARLEYGAFGVELDRTCVR